MKAHVFLASLGLAGSAIAIGQLAAQSVPPGSGLGDDERNSQFGDFRAYTQGENIYDVQPCIISSLTQFGFLGNHPNGTVGLAFRTTGHNNGNVLLPWFPSPDVDHPVIGMNLYRVTAEGRLEQVGLSWLKHAWAAVQGSNCGNCQGGGDSRRLGINCADTYGAGLNADQRWLGPRNEVKPHAHKWMDGLAFTGSHFARNPGGNDTGPHNAIEHKLRVRMGDLTTQGATYYYEGFYYLLKRHSGGSYQWADLFEAPPQMLNNAQHKRVTVSRSGNSFSFSDAGSQVIGPVVSAWGDVQDIAAPDDEGMAYVSSRSVDIGGGQHRYEIAIFNLNFDREITAIEIPIGGAQVSDFGFHAPIDGYWDANNQLVLETPFDISPWTAEVTSGKVRFAAPVPGNDEPNTIRYGTTYTFWFTANAPPAEDAGQISLIPHLPGNHAALLADVVVPDSQFTAASLTDLTVLDGEILSGGLAQLTGSDDEYLRIEARVTGEAHQTHLMRMQLGADTDVQAAAAIQLAVESRITDIESTVQVFMRNWNNGNLPQVGQYTAEFAESVNTVNITNNVTRFIRGSDGRMEILFREVVLLPITLNGFHTLYDEVVVGVR